VNLWLLELNGEHGQNSLEYLMVIGGFAVLLVAALLIAFPAVVQSVASLACSSIDTAVPTPGPSYGSCLMISATPVPVP